MPRQEAHGLHGLGEVLLARVAPSPLLVVQRRGRTYRQTYKAYSVCSGSGGRGMTIYYQEPKVPSAHPADLVIGLCFSSFAGLSVPDEPFKAVPQ